ncbi:MAG: hypothetical protein ACP5O1_04375 [Phycisphaerae bacterium]
MSSLSHENTGPGYPSTYHSHPVLRLILWVACILVATGISLGIDLAGICRSTGSLPIAAALFCCSFGAVFTLAWLLHSTPPDAIKLPPWISQALIAAIALVIWLLRWHTGYALSPAHGEGKQWSWLLCCVLEIASVMLALRFLHLAGESSWWAFLPLPVILYDILAPFPTGPWVWLALATDLLLLTLIFLLSHRKAFAAVCLSTVAGLFPPAVLLLPLIVAPVPPIPYPRRRPVWVLITAASAPMLILWILSELYPLAGFHPWLWAAAIEPHTLIRLGWPWMGIYPLVAAGIWLYVLRAVMKSAPHPLRIARSMILFFTLAAMMNPFSNPWGVLLVLGLSVTVWVSSAWILILLFLPAVAIDNAMYSLHYAAWRVSINIPYFVVVFVLVMRDVVRLSLAKRSEPAA